MPDVRHDQTFIISVLLATYNGSRYVAELLDSLIAQTIPCFSIIVSDGGSHDGTAAIIERYRAKYPDRITVLPPIEGRLDVRSNFNRLIDAARSPYILFCDQDDIWLPSKIDTTMARMKVLEHTFGTSVPLMVHTDLSVTDAQLRVIDRSFVASSGITPEANDLVSLLFRNVATGCTMAMNRPLYLLASPVPAEAVMHDHWVASVAAATGHIGYIEEPIILYRQHGGNTVGAVKVGPADFVSKVHRVLFGNGVAVLLAYSASSRTLLDRVGDRIDPATRRTVAAFANLRDLPWRRQIAFLREAGLARHGWLQTLGLWILVLRLRLTDSQPDATHA